MSGPWKTEAKWKWHETWPEFSELNFDTDTSRRTGGTNSTHFTPGNITLVRDGICRNFEEVDEYWWLSRNGVYEDE